MNENEDEQTRSPTEASETLGSAHHDRDLAVRLLQRRKKGKAPRYKVTHIDGHVTVDPDRSDAVRNHMRLGDLLTTGDGVLAEALLVDMVNAAQWGPLMTSNDVNFMVSTVGAIAPRDPTEALLATQMAAVHRAAMIGVRRLSRAENLSQQDSATNMVTKLTRTFATQLEALKRYRSTGEQNIRVQHVTVNEGGQAIVGEIQMGGRASSQKDSQSHATDQTAEAGRPDEQRPALLSQKQAIWAPLSGAGSEEPESVPDARGESGGAERKAQRCLAAWNGDK